MKVFNKNYLFLVFFNLFNFNLLNDDKLLQDKPAYSVFFKVREIKLKKKISIINKKNIEFFYIFYKSLLVFRLLIKLVFFNFYKNNNYYNNYYFKNFFLFMVLENLYTNTIDNFILKNFFFFKKKKMQLYLYFKCFYKTLIFSTNGVINNKIENKKKSMKKLDKVSIINLKMFLNEIINKKKILYSGTDIFIIFFYLRKLYTKLLKILEKEKFNKSFDLSFFFDLKKSYSLNKLKKKRFIKKKLKKRISKIDNI